MALQGLSKFKLSVTTINVVTYCGSAGNGPPGAGPAAAGPRAAGLQLGSGCTQRGDL